MLRRVAVLLVAWLGAGCSQVPAVKAPESAPRVAVKQQSLAVRVEQRWLLVHLAQPAELPAPHVLVLYVTGDGGWGGKDLDMFEQVRACGQPVAGFSAPDYLDHLAGGADSLSPRMLARDFAEIIRAASVQMGLSAHLPVLLVGVSRGADLVVVAGAESELVGRDLAGVVALALTDEEEYVRRHRHHAGHHAAEPPDDRWLESVRPYDYMRRIAAPLSLIQSTHDQYVPAAEASAWFGPETSRRRFFAIASRNHSFGGARAAMYAALTRSLDWILALGHPTGTSPRP